MSRSDGIQGIEDEPYQGLYRAVAQPKQLTGFDSGPLPDRFDLAEILKSTREAKGWTLDQVAETTRVRRAYLEAFEQAAYDVLPSRAFAIGYVKAYAKALGLDEEGLAEMFKRDVSEPQTRLHAPSGASLEDVKPNYRLYVTAATCLVVAIVIWNVLQHRPVLPGGHLRTSRIDDLPWTQGVPLIRDGVMLMTRPAPTPRDQDIPAAYVTPGLEDGFASIAAAANSSAGAPVPVQDVLPSRAFNPRGAVYGAEPENSAVTIQASRSVNLIVHDAAGTIYFARLLGVGEAYRLPQADQQNLIIEVSDVKALDVFYNGEYAGAMDALKTPIGALNSHAAQMASALDAKQASQHQVASVFDVTPAPEAPALVKASDEPIPYMPAVKPVTAAAVRPAADKVSASAAAVESPAAAASSSSPIPPPATEPATAAPQ